MTTTSTTTLSFSARADLIRAIQSAPYGAQRGMAVVRATGGFLFARLPKSRACGGGVSAASFAAALRAEKMYLTRASRVASLVEEVPEPRATTWSWADRALRPEKGIPGPIPPKVSQAGLGCWYLPEDRENARWASQRDLVRASRRFRREACGQDPLALPQEHRALLRAKRAMAFTDDGGHPWPRPYKMGWDIPGEGHPDAVRWLLAAERWTTPLRAAESISRAITYLGWSW